MSPKPKKPGEVEDGSDRQLGLGLTFAVAPQVGVSGSPAPVAALAPLIPVAPVNAVTPGPALPVFGPASVARPSPSPSPLPSPSPSSISPVLAPPLSDDVPKAPRVFAVNELVRAARLTLESRFGEVRVEGEVSGFKRSGPGHLYFCLKDDQASIDCVMYSREAARVRFSLADGVAVRLRGRLTIYEGRGRFQMSVMEIELQ